MVVNGNSEYVAHAWKKMVFLEKKNLCKFPKQIKSVCPDVRTYFWVTIYYKYYGKKVVSKKFKSVNCMYRYGEK